MLFAKKYHFACLSVELSVTLVGPAKMAESIEMPFRVWTREVPSNRVLDGVQISMGRGNFGGKGRPVVKNRDCCLCAAALRRSVKLLVHSCCLPGMCCVAVFIASCDWNLSEELNKLKILRSSRFINTLLKCLQICRVHLQTPSYHRRPDICLCVCKFLLTQVHCIFLSVLIMYSMTQMVVWSSIAHINRVAHLVPSWVIFRGCTVLLCNQPLRPTQHPTISRMGNKTSQGAVQPGCNCRSSVTDSVVP